MALVGFGVCSGDRWAVSLDYDDVTLLVTDINYFNGSNHPVTLTVTISGTPTVFVLREGTLHTTQDISSRGIHMVATTPPKGLPSFGLPSNIAVSCAWGG